jgi:hypothetical protein
MSSDKIDVPPGLPEGDWECRYGIPSAGEMIHDGRQWREAKPPHSYMFICARRKSPPEFAWDDNVLVVYKDIDGCLLQLCADGIKGYWFRDFTQEPAEFVGKPWQQCFMLNPKLAPTPQPFDIDVVVGEIVRDVFHAGVGEVYADRLDMLNGRTFLGTWSPQGLSDHLKKHLKNAMKAVP